MSILPRPRPEVVEAGAYRTGQVAARVRLQANEWPDPNPASRYVTPADLDRVLLNRYPAQSVELRSVLAKRYGVSPDQLILGNGSNELLLSTFLIFGGQGRTTLVFPPSYAMHSRGTVLAGGSVAHEDVGLPYEVTRERALEAAARVRPHIVAFCTPNNPTGTLVADEVILAVAERHPETLVLVDEAYSDFAGTSVVGAIADHPNILIAKTFSKVFAAAGLRLGILIASNELVDVIRAAQLPYNVGALTQAVALRIARDEPAVRERIAQCRRERERVYQALGATEGVEVFPSVTNFLLFRIRGDTAAMHARFLEQGVLIRDMSSWRGCEGCLRVSIGTPEENDRFIAVLEQVFAPAPA